MPRNRYTVKHSQCVRRFLQRVHGTKCVLNFIKNRENEISGVDLWSS